MTRDTAITQDEKARRFRALHRPGEPLIMANPWDVGSARILQGKGARALATTSAGLAFAMGHRDGQAVDRDTHLAHARAIVAAVDLPVSGDFENGYGHRPEDCAEAVRLAAEAGLVGIGIEDTVLPGAAAYDRDLAAERIYAAAEAARALPHDFVLTARADGLLTGSYDQDEALRRLMAFEAAGADCLFAPTPDAADFQARICAALSKPVNVIATGQICALSRAQIGALGAARISLGSSLARLAARTIADQAAAMYDRGDFSAMGQALPFEALNAFLPE